MQKYVTTQMGVRCDRGLREPHEKEKGKWSLPRHNSKRTTFNILPITELRPKVMQPSNVAVLVETRTRGPPWNSLKGARGKGVRRVAISLFRDDADVAAQLEQVIQLPFS